MQATEHVIRRAGPERSDLLRRLIGRSAGIPEESVDLRIPAGIVEVDGRPIGVLALKRQLGALVVTAFHVEPAAILEPARMRRLGPIRLPLRRRVARAVWAIPLGGCSGLLLLAFAASEPSVWVGLTDDASIIPGARFKIDPEEADALEAILRERVVGKDDA